MKISNYTTDILKKNILKSNILKSNILKNSIKYIFVFAIILSSCSTSKKTTTPTTAKNDTTNKPQNTNSSSQPKSASELALENIGLLTNATPNLYLDGTMRVSGVPIGINFEAVIKRKDSLKLVLTGPFGIAVGALMATPDKFLFYNASEGELIEGTPNKTTFKKLIQIELDYQDIVALLRGELGNMPLAGQYATKTNGDSLFYSTTNIPKEDFVILPKPNLIALYSRYSSSNANTKDIAVRYSDHKTIADKRSFAMKSEAIIYSSNQNLRLTVDEVKTELDKEQNCVINFPKDVVRKKM